MSLRLLDQVVVRLDESGISYAVVGATAMGLHGVSRSTLDTDLLVRDRSILRDEFWSTIGDPEIRIGDADDAFHGVVRFDQGFVEKIDIIVPKYVWMDGVLARAEIVRLDGTPLRVASMSDLTLMKLFAGGVKDRLDVFMLLESVDDDSLIREVDERIVELDEEAQALWHETKAAVHL